MNLENFFISQFEKKYIGDDAAVVGEMLYSKDAFFENVHFKRSWLSYYAIAKKAMLVNISDAVAMGATPLYALLSVAMPKDISRAAMQELAAGFKDAAEEFGITIIGGDTLSNTKLDITVTIISQSKKPLYRKGCKEGYMLAYTGSLGRSAWDLKRLLNLGTIHKESKFSNIRLRSTFVTKARRFLAAGMDISDGLMHDLEKLTALNRIGVRFFRQIPKQVACSGEEYEMLVAFDPRHKKALLRRAKQSRTPLNIFGIAARNSYTNRCKAHHF